MNSHAPRTLSASVIPRFMALLFLAPLPARAGAAGKDVIVMTNGDRLTGEVKGLQNGVLYVKTVYLADKIGVDWAQVQAVESSADYQITLVNGIHMTGKITREPNNESSPREFLIMTISGNTRVPASNVAGISTQKETFWRQLSGSMEAGYSFTSGNSQTTITTDASANYANPNWNTGASIATSFSGQ